MWFNIDEKRFSMGKSYPCKVIYGRQGRGMIGLAQDGNQETITVIETIYGVRTVLLSLVIYMGAK